MNRSGFRAIVASLLLILLACLAVACDLAPARSTATPMAPAAAAVVEPTLPEAQEAPTAQSAPGPGPGREPAQGTVLSSFTTADFSGSGTCVMCHQGLQDEAGADVSITTHWRSTMMANAARDPVWQAKVSAEVAALPALQEVIEKKCVSCHMPMARTQAEVEGGTVAAQGDGFFDAAHPLHEAAMEGVSCTLCHQVGDVGLGTMESFTGGYSVDVATEPPDRQAFGPYEQPFGRPMQMHTGFVPVYSAHTEAAELCATCHNLYTPYVDAEGNVLGEFPEQTPYTEWQNSSFGGAVPCQSCHMPTAQGGVVISTMPGRLGPRQPFFQHWFVGGNALMLRVLSDWGGEMGVTADTAHLDATMARVVDQVGGRTARLTVESLARENGFLTASLKVTALTGHKFPTSFPSRRAWLHVTVADAAGNVIWESGAWNADGTIVGNAADGDPAAFEPHYDVITQPDQVQIYEPIMGDNEGRVTYTLLRAASYLKDNRVLPAGADKGALPADVAVYGEAAGDANFAGGSDVVTYRMDVGDATGPFTMSAELLYEPLSYRFVMDLLAAGTELTERFGGYYRATDRTPLVVAAIEPATVR
ncbi:MAG TPA: hypothetical protein VLC95_20250 [Anaerolineae bacterium]|nr:hypothetical protein [Anaerolineae bacterium]